MSQVWCQCVSHAAVAHQLVEVPRLSQRLESFLWKRQFPALLAELAADTARLFMACNEVKQSKKLPQILKVDVVCVVLTALMVMTMNEGE